jgi:glycosyltransferase involved in cell wall biosynthesis
MSGRILGAATAVICPSQDTANRVERQFPGARLQVRPHPEDATSGSRSSRPGKVRRIAVLGAISRVKGYDVLLSCALDAQRRQLGLEFVLVGYSQDDFELFRTGKVFVTGEYQVGEGAHLAGQAACDLAFLPSIWPETWCYALTELWRAGLEVVAFDIGAQAERIRQRGRGHLIPTGMTPNQINDLLLSFTSGTGARQ